MTATTGGLIQGGTIWAVGWQKLGMALITESFRWAAFGMTGATTSGSHVQRISEAQAFLLQGSSLDVALDFFGIEQTGDEIRGSFKRWLRRRQTPYYP